MSMTEQQGHDWVAQTQERIKQLETLDMTDRLACYVALWRIVEAIGNSVSGWRSWLVRPGIITDFNEEELRDFCQRLREMAVHFLEFDIKATEKLKIPPSQPKPETQRRYWA